MSLHRCYLCSCDPGPFFVWTSSRIFDRENLMKVMKKSDKHYRNELSQGVKVCFKCNEELKNR